MKEIKSNQSKIINSYLINSKEEIMVRSIAEEKQIKLTEISIMDRQSNGSFIVKDRIMDTYRIARMIEPNKEKEVNTNSEVVTPVSVNNKEYKALADIDKKIMTIDSMLETLEK